MRQKSLFHSFLRGGILLLVISFLSLQATYSQVSYFPPVDSDEWGKETLNSLGWDTERLADLLAWLPTEGTRSLIILKDGKIAVEEYWGAKLTGLGQMDQNSMWYWSSAAKTLTAAMIGVAEQEKALKSKDKVSTYLGQGWTAVPSKREGEIRISNLLSMSSGIDERVANPEDTSPESLRFFAKAGERWAYHQASHTLLQKILEKAVGQEFQEFYKANLGSQIGMKGFWQVTEGNLGFFSDARSMARFGLLLFHHGVWAEQEVINKKYFGKMIVSSQADNPSYGYLTWLNSSKGYKIPGSQVKQSDKLVTSAPQDMFMALGENGQILMVIPSKGLVIVRQGSYSDDSKVPIRLVRDFWERIKLVVN